MNKCPLCPKGKRDNDMEESNKSKQLQDISKIEINTFEDLIKAANLGNYSNLCEFWEINGSSQKLAYLTHNYFRYFGKFPPTIAKNLIKLYTKKNHLVVDVMVGSGTTLVEAAIEGRTAIGYDVNSFSILLSKVKTTKIDTNILEIEFNKIKKNFRSKNKLKTKKYIPDLKNIDHWFNKKVQYELAEIKSLILSIKQKDIRDFFLITFASILRRASCAGSHTGRIFFDKGWKYRDPYLLFEKQFYLMKSRMDEFNKLSFQSITEYTADARSIPLEDNKANLVICHPPYYNLYKFSHTNKFELSWLDFDIKDIVQKEIFDGFKLGNVEKQNLYMNDLFFVVTEMNRILNPNGRAALMIGDSIAQNKRIFIAKQIIDYMSLNKIPIHKIILRKPKYSEATYATSQRRNRHQLGHNLTDFIIIFGKKYENSK